MPQELELLSVRESVELLSAVAQLDTSEVSPCMIEIVRHRGLIVFYCLPLMSLIGCVAIIVMSQAQLCGRLPVGFLLHRLRHSDHCCSLSVSDTRRLYTSDSSV